MSVDVLGRHFYFINYPEGVHHVLVANESNYPKSEANQQTLRMLMGNGLFVSSGELWARQRKIASPATHGSRLPEYARTMISCGQGLVEQWRKQPPGQVLDVMEPFTMLTANIISRLMFDQPLEEKNRILYDAFKEYSASHGRFHLFEVLGLPPWLPRPGQRRARRAVQQFRRVLGELL